MSKPRFSRLALSMLAASVPLALLLGRVPSESAHPAKAAVTRESKHPPRPGVADPTWKRKSGGEAQEK
jgi:hypothetical protein